MELASIAASAFHAIMGFMVWRCVVTTTAALMVYHRVAKELSDAANMDEGHNMNDNDQHHAMQYRQLQAIKVERDRAS